MWGPGTRGISKKWVDFGDHICCLTRSLRLKDQGQKLKELRLNMFVIENLS